MHGRMSLFLSFFKKGFFFSFGFLRLFIHIHIYKSIANLTCDQVWVKQTATALPGQWEYIVHFILLSFQEDSRCAVACQTGLVGGPGCSFFFASL